jgi:hypothetical protein
MGFNGIIWDYMGFNDALMGLYGINMGFNDALMGLYGINNMG